MKKIILTAMMLLMMFTATVFAEEETTQGFEYTSQTYGFKIACPAEPKVVVNPFEDPNKKGELLVFANDGIKILYGYQILLDAFDTKEVPDFNKANKKVLDEYLEKLRINEAYEYAEIGNIAADNKAVFAVTAKEIEEKDDNGEVEGVWTADAQNAIAFFRTKSGRCISIQFITTTIDDEAVENFRKSVMSYRDATDLAMPEKSSKKKKK